MRLLLLSFALAVVTIGDGHASSFVHVAPPSAGRAPSIVTLGEPAHKLAGAAATAQAAVPKPKTRDAAEDGLIPLAYALPDMRPASAVRPVSISPSIVAFDVPEPPVTLEKVAAIHVKPHEPVLSPMVIRGGIVGDGHTRIVIPAAVEPAPQAAERDAGRKPGAPVNGHQPPAAARPEQLPAPPPAPMPAGRTSAPQ